jgi:hypothetical protein
MMTLTPDAEIQNNIFSKRFALSDVTRAVIKFIVDVCEKSGFLLIAKNRYYYFYCYDLGFFLSFFVRLLISTFIFD